MGQYYTPCLLKKNYKTSKSPVIGALYAHMIGMNGLKLMEHSYVGNLFVKAATYMLLGNESHPFVWCGDYADEINNGNNMYMFAGDNEFEHKYTEKFIADHPDLKDEEELKYIINHTKKQYVVVNDNDEIHPLPLLTADGNGRGGGDFWGTPQDMVGIWAYDVIECNDGAPDGYEEIYVKFEEK